MKKIFFMLFMMTVYGCQTEKTLIKYRNDYCSKTSSSVVKEIAIKAIESKVPFYPKDGICTGFVEPE